MTTKTTKGLREQRAAAGVSLDTLARWSRVSKASLSRYEAGDRIMPPVVAATVAKGLRALGATDASAGALFAASVKATLDAGGAEAAPAVMKSLTSMKDDGQVTAETRSALARIVEELRRLVGPEFAEDGFSGPRRPEGMQAAVDDNRPGARDVGNRPGVGAPTTEDQRFGMVGQSRDGLGRSVAAKRRASTRDALGRSKRRRA